MMVIGRSILLAVLLPLLPACFDSGEQAPPAPAVCFLSGYLDKDTTATVTTKSKHLDTDIRLRFEAASFEDCRASVEHHCVYAFVKKSFKVRDRLTGYFDPMGSSTASPGPDGNVRTEFTVDQQCHLKVVEKPESAADSTGSNG